MEYFFMDNKKRVLVLAGGGAKGAYSFGCLQTFKSEGITFDAVSGTSVGAINAVLWSTGSLETGENLWNNISFSSVYPVQIINPKKNNRLFIRLISIGYVLLRMCWSAIKGIPIPGSIYFRFALSIITILPLSIAFLRSSYYKFGRVNPDLLICLLIGLFLIHFYSFKRKNDFDFANFTGLLSLEFIISIVLLSGTFHISDIISAKILQIPKVGKILRRIMFGILLFGLVIIDLVLYWYAYRVFNKAFHKDISILGSGPLRAKLKFILEGKKLIIPTFVTVAKETEIFDPDNPHWFTWDVNAKGMVMWHTTWEPTLQKKWCPSYIELNSQIIDEAINYCAASAALPFGIVPPISINGIDYVDGGIIDNCPIIPFYDLSENDEIYILLLTPYTNDDDAIRGSKISYLDCKKRKRLLDLAKFPIPGKCQFEERKYTKKNKLPNEVPYNLSECKAKIIIFYPKENLGGMFSGVMNFSGKYSKKMMALGRKDSLAKIRSLKNHTQ